MWKIVKMFFSTILLWLGLEKRSRAVLKEKYDAELKSAVNDKSFEAVVDYVGTKSKVDKLERVLAKDDLESFDSIGKLETKGNLRIKI